MERNDTDNCFVGSLQSCFSKQIRLSLVPSKGGVLFFVDDHIPIL
jgi:hypothetical protein